MSQFKFPPELLAQHLAVLGKTGSGKTSTAKLVIEQVVPQGARVCILDPIKSDWWGLTSSADGKRPGLPFHVLGGPHGHVPLHERAGKAIGELVAAGELPLSIIDMADFAPGGQQHFFVDFAPVLLRRMRGILYLVMEEAHLFAPKERSGVGAENMAIHWAKMLATAGRSKGIRIIVATQRTQALHNAILGSCDTLITHRLVAPADQAPVVSWLKSNVDAATREKVAGSLSSLRTGQGWVCSGEAKVFELVQFPRITTYDNTATPTGSTEDRQVKTAAVDVEKLRAAIGEAVKQAEENDPKLLRKRIAELERQVAARATAAPPVGVPPAEVTRRVDEAVRAARAAATAGPQISKALVAGVEKIAAGLQQVQAELAGMPVDIVPRARTVVRTLPQREASVAPAPRRREVAVSEGVSAPQQRLLDALAWWKSAGVGMPTRHQVAFVAGYTVNGHFNNQCGELHGRGLVDYPGGGLLALSASGSALAHAPDAHPTRDDLVHRVLGVLKGEPQRRVFQALVDVGEPLSREELAARCGYTVNGHFNNLCGALNGIGVAEYPSKGFVGLAGIIKGMS